ncbi:Metacaspase-1 [Cyberlindnera fabianii]|uniref:Metacaspase-1 n=1 Tax=Cyberlindnera fabianii TaxID=36022 RepID=A0A1V2L4R6_CYBFA|nr:Metacaspase-1 [Cyberlindnera fabianii]
MPPRTITISDLGLRISAVLPRMCLSGPTETPLIFKASFVGILRVVIEERALFTHKQITPQSFGVQGYEYKYSNCTGRRKALLIGINYIGTKAQLKGCINDVNNVKQFLVQHGYAEGDIVVLTDDQTQMVKVPMRANIIKAIGWLVNGAQPNDSLFFHYSGHGSQVPDQDGDEEDGIDETIVPLDYETSGQIIDDELHARLVQPLPAGVRLTALFDSCHSGSVLDLPYTYSTKGVLKEPNLAKEVGEGLLQAAKSYIINDQTNMLKGLKALGEMVMKGGPNEDAYEKTKRTKTAPADVVMFSGSKDDQTSADANEGGVPTGAMSFAFIKVMNKAPQQTYLSLLQNMREIMVDKYTQKPQFSASHPIDVNLQFIF